MSFILLLAGLTAESCSNQDVHIQIADNEILHGSVKRYEKEKKSMSDHVSGNIRTNNNRRLRLKKGK